MKLQFTWLLFLLVSLVAAQKTGLSTEILEEQREEEQEEAVFRALEFLAEGNDLWTTDTAEIVKMVQTVVDTVLTIGMIESLVKKYLDRQVRFDSVSDIPSMVPSDAPSLVPSDAPSIVASDAPSIIPSDVPSMVPNDSPSRTPSDPPSMSPTTVPTDVLPSDMPSISPGVWDGPDPSDTDVPEGFESCTSIGSSASETGSMTVLYAYKLQISKNATVESVLTSIEGLLQTYLMDSMCGSALAISPAPADAPGAVCGPSDDLEGDGPCYYISGKTQLLVDVDAVGDTVSLYCDSLENIRAFLSSGAVEKSLADVQTITSPVEESLVPDYCAVNADSETMVPSPAPSGSSESSSEAKRDTGIIMVTLVATILGLALFAGLVVYNRRRRSERQSAFDIVEQLRVSRSDQKRNLFGSADCEDDFDFSSLPVSSVDSRVESMMSEMAQMSEAEEDGRTPTSMRSESSSFMS